MQSTNGDLFEESGSVGLQTHIDAFEGWLAAREEFGAIREQSSVAVYRSMWAALSAWCVGRGLHLDALKPDHFEAYLLSRGGAEELLSLIHI